MTPGHPEALGRLQDAPRPCDRGQYRLNLPLIASSLQQVQADFERINRTLSAPRDPMTDEVRENMLAGYRCVDDALAQGLDLFALPLARRLSSRTTALRRAVGTAREARPIAWNAARSCSLRCR